MIKEITLNLELVNGEIVQVGKEKLNTKVIGECHTTMFTENDSDNVGIAKIGEIQVDYGNYIYLYQVNIYNTDTIEFYVFENPCLYDKNGYFETINIKGEKLQTDCFSGAINLFMEKVMQACY